MTCNRYEPDGSSTVVARCSPRAFGIGTSWPVEEATVAARVRDSAKPARIDDYGGLGGPVATAVLESGSGPGLGTPDRRRRHGVGRGRRPAPERRPLPAGAGGSARRVHRACRRRRSTNAKASRKDLRRARRRAGGAAARRDARRRRHTRAGGLRRGRRGGGGHVLASGSSRSTASNRTATATVGVGGARRSVPIGTAGISTSPTRRRGSRPDRPPGPVDYSRRCRARSRRAAREAGSLRGRRADRRRRRPWGSMMALAAEDEVLCRPGPRIGSPRFTELVATAISNTRGAGGPRAASPTSRRRCGGWRRWSRAARAAEVFDAVASRSAGSLIGAPRQPRPLHVGRVQPGGGRRRVRETHVQHAGRCGPTTARSTRERRRPARPRASVLRARDERASGAWSRGPAIRPRSGRR